MLDCAVAFAVVYWVMPETKSQYELSGGPVDGAKVCRRGGDIPGEIYVEASANIAGGAGWSPSRTGRYTCLYRFDRRRNVYVFVNRIYK